MLMKAEFDENSSMRLSTARASHCSFYLPNSRRLPTKSCCENWSVWLQNSATLRILIAPYPRARSRVWRPCWLPDLGSFQCLRKIKKRYGMNRRVTIKVRLPSRAMPQSSHSARPSRSTDRLLPPALRLRAQARLRDTVCQTDEDWSRWGG